MELLPKHIDCVVLTTSPQPLGSLLKKRQGRCSHVQMVSAPDWAGKLAQGAVLFDIAHEIVKKHIGNNIRKCVVLQRGSFSLCSAMGSDSISAMDLSRNCQDC